MTRPGRTVASTDVALPNGMFVSCLQAHEVSIVEREVRGYFDHHVRFRPGDVVFDVGANIGLFSLAVYGRCAGHVDLYAFEPVEAIFRLLQANVARNLSGGRIELFQYGLSSHSEDTEFAFYPEAPVLSTAYPLQSDDLTIMEEAVVENIMHLAEAPPPLRLLRWVPPPLRRLIVRVGLRRTLRAERVVCRMQTLSWFVAERAIGRIDVLKIDAEKAELEILRGIEAADWPKIRQVVVDVHDEGGRLDVVTALLRQQGLGEIVVDQPPTLINSNIHTVFANRGE